MDCVVENPPGGPYTVTVYIPGTEIVSYTLTSTDISNLADTANEIRTADGLFFYDDENSSSGHFQVLPADGVPSSSLMALEVTDGTHNESGITEINFTSGATVSSGGTGVADVAISGGGGSLEVRDGTNNETGVSEINFLSGAAVSSGGSGIAESPSRAAARSGPPPRAYRNSALTLTAASPTKIPVNTVDFDTGGYFDVATNHRYNVPATGIYLVVAEVHERLGHLAGTRPAHLQERQQRPPGNGRGVEGLRRRRDGLHQVQFRRLPGAMGPLGGGAGAVGRLDLELPERSQDRLSGPLGGAWARS